MDQIQNCNYAVQLGKTLGFSLVGIQGKDIYDGNRTLILALVWQLMRAYTLEVLARCTTEGTYATDKEIVRWVNEKLKSAGKSTHINGFQDSSISNGVVILDLIDAIQPGAINYDLINHGDSEKVSPLRMLIMSVVFRKSWTMRSTPSLLEGRSGLRSTRSQVWCSFRDKCSMINLQRMWSKCEPRCL